MNTELYQSVISAQEAEYDACAKRLLGQKIILAHILTHTVDEFKEMDPQQIASLIEGEPMISVIPIDPGLTNTSHSSRNLRIRGFNSEDSEINEGFIRFDIVFYVRMKNGLSQMIINVEAQKEEPHSYSIINRAVFYVSRLISSQKGRDFDHSDYDSIRQVYSIWICMNTKENSLNHLHLCNDQLLGNCRWKGNLDLLNIILIGLSYDLPEPKEELLLHRLLKTLLSVQLTSNEKLDIMKNEYHIAESQNIREEVSYMCNLSQGIREEGIAIGEAKGEAKGEARGKAAAEAQIIRTMHSKGFTLEQIAAATEKNPDAIRSVLQENKANQ